jgi:uncharacterized protein
MTTRQIKCPRCGKPTLFTPENASRPFCSDRCKVIDLGAWADEQYTIPVKPPTGMEDMGLDDESGEGQSDAKDEGNGGNRGPQHSRGLGNPSVH